MTSISRSWTSPLSIYSADRRSRCSSSTLLPKGEMTHRGKPDRSVGHPPCRAADDRRREGRHLGSRPDRGDACKLCTNDSEPDRRAHYVQPGRRALRRVQRLPVPLRDRAAHLRLHADQPEQAGQGGGEIPPRRRTRSVVIDRCFASALSSRVIASAAKQSTGPFGAAMGGFVASLLAMTGVPGGRPSRAPSGVLTIFLLAL
jgi:hypothetical protein